MLVGGIDVCALDSGRQVREPSCPQPTNPPLPDENEFENHFHERRANDGKIVDRLAEHRWHPC
jgi:hypothetical protein